MSIKMEFLRIATQTVLGSAIILMGPLAFGQESTMEGAAPEAEVAPTTEEATSTPASTSAPTSEPAAEPEASVAVTATPAETGASDDSAAEPAEEAKKPVGISVDVGISSIYNFRGLNVFMEKTMQDQNAFFAPSLTWSIFDTGLSLGYWGAYQLTGDNKTYMVDYGLGHEQDLILGYSKGFADDSVSLNAAFTYYFYPFADEDVAGCKNPSIIEPTLGIGIATVLDIGFSVSYFHAIQKEIALLRHAYFNFSLGKGFTFNDTFGMDLGMGFGIKAWLKSDGVKNDYNRFDLHFDWGIPINLTDKLYIKPAVRLAWTDLKTVAVDDDPDTAEVETSRTAKAGDEYMVYASINFGANF